MEREVTSTYSINTSQSRISYLSNINNFVHDSNLYNQANLLEMIYNLRNENRNLMGESLILENQLSQTANSNLNEVTDNLSDSDNEDDDAENEVMGNGETNHLNTRNINRENPNNITNSVGSFDFFEDSSLISNNLQQSSSNQSNDDPFLDEPNYRLLKTGRAATAPAKPFSEVEDFKWSTQFLNLEKVVMYSNRLIIIKGETKIDVDSEEGSEICKKFLDQLEKLIKVIIFTHNKLIVTQS
jgi:hypothetical protein